jgi:hypothetical protein
MVGGAGRLVRGAVGGGGELVEGTAKTVGKVGKGALSAAGNVVKGAGVLFEKGNAKELADKIKELLSGETKTVLEKINQDPCTVLVKKMADSYLKNVAPRYDEINLKNITTQRTYMKAILELSPKLNWA